MTTELQTELILKEMRQGFRRIDEKLEVIDEKLASVIVEVAFQSQKLDQLVTREEFDGFKDQVLTHFDGLSKQVEVLQEEHTLSAA